MLNESEPPYRKTGVFEFETKLTPEQQKMAEVQAEIYKQALLYSLICGKQGYGKNYRAKEKLMWDHYKSVPIDTIDNVWKPATISADRITKPKLPQKICTYRKPKLYWFGELHPSNNFIWDEGFTMARHWDVGATTLSVRGMDPSRNMSVFVGISEPAESERVDQDFLKSLTVDEWVETKTYDKKSASWKPQGEIIMMSGKPLKINEKSKETLEQVKRITHKPV